MKDTHMNRGLSIFVLAVAVLLIAVAVLHFYPQHALMALWTLGTFVAGTVTVTYASPVSGTTAPTAQQVRNISSVTAVLNWGDTDTSATITHNFAATAAQLAALQPWVDVYAVALNGSPSAPPPFVSTLATNSITITKSSVTNSGGTFNVIIQRPNSIIT